jgi:AcrR family transcriptional regulator
MKISKEARAQNKVAIIATARQLFSEKGFKKTTIRDIAKEMKMAVGTLFNYFPGKDALAFHLIRLAMDEGTEDYHRRLSGQEELVEDLFLFITSRLRKLQPYRSFLTPVLKSSMGILENSPREDEAKEVRENHLLILQDISAKYGYQFEPNSFLAQIYWSLYLGIMAVWINDKSYNQEESMAYIDYSLQVFNATLANEQLSQKVSYAG